MKIKIEMDLPRWLSRAILVALPATIAAIGAWVYAGVPNTFEPGKTLTAQALNDNFAAVATPPGTVVAFAGANVPSGWLLCDGSAVSRTTYASLLAAIGNAHGGGDGLTTFNLPDYRGLFLRGVDSAAVRDKDSAGRTAPQAGVAAVTGGPGNSGGAVGSVQDDAFASHTHTIALGAGSWSWPGAGSNVFTSPYSYGITSKFYDQTDGLATYGNGGSETRPVNAYVNYIIKY